MLELPDTDLRKRALESDDDPPILVAVEIDVPATQGGTIYLNGSSGHKPVINNHIYLPNNITNIKAPKQESGAHRGLFECTLVDINNNFYNKIASEGYTGMPIRTGYFWWFDNQWTDILWRYYCHIVSITQNDDLLLIQAANFLASIDNYHTVVATDRSQRTRDSSDSSLKYISTAKLHRFGGASRG